MRHVEDWHWWYVGLRGLLKRQWNTHVSRGNPRVGDMGCGTGANLAMLQGEGSCFGLDRSSSAIAFCRERGLSGTVLASVDSIPCPSETFDAVLSMDVLPHKWVRDKQGALTEMARVLKPGGYLFLNLPAYQWLHSSHDVAVEQDWRATASVVRRMLASSGLEPVRITYWNTLLFPGVAVLRLLRKGKKTVESASDFRHTAPTALDSLCGSVLALERLILRYIDLPFGLSVFAVARKPLPD